MCLILNTTYIYIFVELQGPITSQSCEDDDDVGPVFSMVQGVDKKQRRKSRRNMSTSPVDENRNGDRSRSSLRRPESKFLLGLYRYRLLPIPILLIFFGPI